MAVQAALSQIASFLTPTPQKNTGRRIQPKRHARKRPDDDFVYPDNVSTSSLLVGNTLSDSELFISWPKHNTALETLPVTSGTDSLLFETLSQTAIPETQRDSLAVATTPVADTPSVVTTPVSRHGRLMRSSLSASMFDDCLTPSLLPMSDLDVEHEVSAPQLSSTPFNNSGTVVHSPPQFKGAQKIPPQFKDTDTQTTTTKYEDSDTQTMPRTSEDCATQISLQPMYNKECQTSLNEDVALFRSNGNLSVLSNFYLTKLHANGITFKSAEHAYQHLMAVFHGRPDVARQILFSKYAARAKKLAIDVTKCQTWHKTKTTIMADILLVKARQCPTFRKTLLETDTKRLVHNIDTDSFWGCGPDLRGQNQMGVLLEELRGKLRTEANTPPAPSSSVSSDNPPKRTETQTKTGQIPVATDEYPALTKTSSETTTPPPGARRLPASDRPPVLFLGNSNVRQMAGILCEQSVNASSFFYPGGSMDFITSRIRHTSDGTNPSHIVVMAGDIEAANGMEPEYALNKNPGVAKPESVEIWFDIKFCEMAV